jgi:hypothetical protein
VTLTGDTWTEEITAKQTDPDATTGIGTKIKTDIMIVTENIGTDMTEMMIKGIL